MTAAILPPQIAAIAVKARIDPEDVRHLRATVYGNGVVSREEAEWAFILDAAARHTCPEWTEFFVEALTDFVVHQEHPAGHVSEANAAWLLGRITHDGRIDTRTELDLLVKILSAAESAPAGLAAFALDQVSAAVLEGEGPLARGGKLVRGVIGRDEVELMRRILFAYGSHGGLAVTREEAEVLFDLNDRSREAENDPAWSDLFVKAIANFLMAARGYQAPSRDEALQRAAWLDAPTRGVAGFMGDMASGLLTLSLRNIWGRRGEAEESAQAIRNREMEAEIRAAEAVTSDEIRWLAERIGRDGVIHDNERALLRFLRDESPDIHPSLRTLLDTAA